MIKFLRQDHGYADRTVPIILGCGVIVTLIAMGFTIPAIAAQVEETHTTVETLQHDYHVDITDKEARALLSDGSIHVDLGMKTIVIKRVARDGNVTYAIDGNTEHR